MDKKIERRFPWLPYVQRRLLESSCSDYEILTLEWLQEIIAKEIQEVERKRDLTAAKLLLKGIKFLYYHFCKIWTFCNKVSPCCFEFTAHMKDAWVHILSSIIKIYMLLSQGRKSKWINQALNVIATFPGERNLIYDTLLLIHKLNKKYQPAYGAILKTLLMPKPLFIPVTIDDPAEFLKVYLLARRLKLLLKNRAEKVELQRRVSKILAPSDLWHWLLYHDFCIPWTRKGVKKVTLGVDIIKKLCVVGNKPQVEIVETLRKILLPGLCTVRKAEQRPHVKIWSRKREYVSAACADQVSSEDDEEITTRINRVSAQVPSEYKDIEAIDRKNKRKIHVSVQCTKVKRKKLKRKRNKHLEDDKEGMNGSKSGMRKSVGKLKNVTKDVRRVKKKKNRKKQNSVHLEENLRYGTGQADLPSQGCSSEFAKLATEEIKKQRKQKLDRIAKKILNKPNQSIDKDSCLLKDSMEDMQQSAGGRRRPEIKSKKKHQKCINDSDSECEPKSKKRRQREMIVAEKNSDNVNVRSCDHSLLEDISQTAKITKRKRQRAKESGSYSKETELIAIKSESDAEDLPVVIGEINVDKTVTYERECLSKSRIVDYDSSSSDDDQPVILREVKHLKKFDLNSSRRKKNQNTKTELKSDPEVETKIMAKNIFIIDSEPSSCFRETGANQIAYDEIYVAEEKGASSFQNPDNISSNGEDLNSSITLTDLQAEDIPAESNSRLKITDCSQTFEETRDSCASCSSPFRSDQQEPVSEKEIRTSSDNQTSTHINTQDSKLENEDNVISSTMGKHSGHTAQTDEESSLGSAVQTEGLDYSPNETSALALNKWTRFDRTSKTLMNRSAKIPMQTDSEKETSQNIYISQEALPVLESHESPVSDRSLDCDSSAQEIQNSVSSTISKLLLGILIFFLRLVSESRSSLQNKITSEVVSDSASSFQVHNLEVHEHQGSCAGWSSPLRNDQQEIRTSSDNQTSTHVNSQDCRLENEDNVISSTIGECSGHTAQTDEESSLGSAVQTEGLDYSPNETSDLVVNCIKFKPSSQTLMDRNAKIPMQTDSEKETTHKIYISQEALPVLESYGSPVSERSLDCDSSAQEIAIQNDEHPLIYTETTENNTKVNVESELPFKNNEFSCEVKKEEITEKSRFSESSIDSPPSTTSCLKTEEISSPNGAKRGYNLRSRKSVIMPGNLKL